MRAAGATRALLRRTDDHAVEIVDDVLAVCRVAEPPARRVGDEQLLAKQAPADRGQVGAEAAVLRNSRAERIAHELWRLAARLHETGRPAVVARTVEFQRIGLAAIHAAYDEIDALQALERLEEDAVAGRAQVAALDQQVAKIAREVGVTEVVVVVRAGRQQRDARIAAPGEHRQVGLQALEEGTRRTPLHASNKSPAMCVCTTRLASA